MYKERKCKTNLRKKKNRMPLKLSQMSCESLACLSVRIVLALLFQISRSFRGIFFSQYVIEIELLLNR